MIRDIIIVQDYLVESILYRLDPKANFVSTLIYILSLFVMKSLGYFLGIAFLIGVILLSTVPFLFVIWGL